MVPWDYHADLSAERLIVVALLLQRARRNAADRFEPEIGDTDLSLGLDAYLYGKFEIEQAAGASEYPWLTVVNSSLRFQFRIGQVLMRFWRGDIYEPRESIIEPTVEEQGFFDFGAGDYAAGMIFRINVVSDVKGNLLEANFVAFRNGIAECVWPIPFRDAAPLVSGIRPDLPIGPDLPAPRLGPPIRAVDADRNTSGKEE